MRELREETGLESVKLGPCIWTRRHVWQWGNVWYDNQERFFFLRTPRFNVVPVAPDMIDGEPQLDHRWWSLQEIEAAREVEFRTQTPRYIPGASCGWPYTKDAH